VRTYNYGAGVMTASGLNILAGIWLIISPFVLGFAHTATPLWNTLIAGVIVGLLAIGRVVNPNRSVGLSWINLLLGIWLIISPFLLPGYGGAYYPSYTVATPNDVVLGIVVGLLAIWSLASTPTLNRAE
jgi:hypothetical protein